MSWATDYIQSNSCPCPITGCWNWSGTLRSNSKWCYGLVTVPMSLQPIWGKQYQSAHRFAFTHLVGQIPARMCVRHKCDNTRCVNPDHLELGSHADNMRDKRIRRRHAIGEDHFGSRLTENSVIAIRDMYATGGYSQRDLALRFSCRQSTIWYILNNHTWRHLL